MGNPESMKPTMLSRHEKVIEANVIIGLEAFKVMGEARLAGNAVIYERAQSFLQTGAKKPRR